MTDNMFDNFVRDKLTNHESPVPQGLWDKIERKKDKEPKGGFWLRGTTRFGGLALLLLGLGVGYFLLQDNKQISQSNTTQLSETAAAKDNGSATNTTTTTNNTNTNTTTNNNAANTTSASNGDDQHLNSTTGTTVAAHKSQGDHRVINDNNTIEKKNTSNVTRDSHKNNIAHGTVTAGHQQQIAATPNAAKEGRSVENNVVLKNSRHKTTVNNYAGDKTVNAVNGNEDPSVASTIATGNFLALSRGVTAYDSKTFSLATKEKFDLTQIRIFGIDCPTAGRQRRDDLYLEVYGSPDLAMKSVSAKSNPAYVAKKDSTETTQMGYTAGFRFTKSIGDNLLVKAGLQYSQINERFDLKTENERRITTVITIRTIQTAGGADTTVRDTTSLIQIGYRVQRTYNRYRSIDIPLLLSYEFGDEKWKFAVNAGVILNLHSWYNGQALNDSLNVVSLNSKSNSVYKQNIGLGIYAGFSIIKPVSKRTDLFLEPYFRYNLSNMAKGTAYTQKFNAAGISLGLRYNLKKQRR
jgi:hypothetical protein